MPEAKEWFVVDRKSRQIVNVITTSQTDTKKIRAKIPYLTEDAYDLTLSPSQELLNNYRYYSERP